MKTNDDQSAAINLPSDEERSSDEEHEDLGKETLEIADVQTDESREDRPSSPGLWMIIAGGVAVVAIVLASAIRGADNPATEQSANVGSSPIAPPPVVPGSLGMNISDMTDLWNSLVEPPKITRGLVHSTEPGEYDSFIYRFGDWGRLAGAYDPSTDAVYALVATGQFSNEATAQLYLHLCFMLHPYSQECIDNYFEKGLAYGTLADFSGATHQAEWQMDDQTWRLDIEGNVLTIRVLAEAVS